MAGLRVTEGGLETSLIYRHGADLPLFAAFPLLEDETGRRALRAYWEPYLRFVEETGASFVVDTATWRANPDWGDQLGYDALALARANAAAAGYARTVADEMGGADVSGVVGPRGDGYVVGEVMTAEEAEEYHLPQVRALAEAGVDQVAALTLTYPEEATGFVRAAVRVGVPAVVSFTVETDGRLPTGDSLREAVERVDADTDEAPLGFMVNCAHPVHLTGALDDGAWIARVTGLRANASTMSHAELDAAEELDDGDPADLAARYRQLRTRLPALELLGGCCGTDHRHVRAVHAACSTG